MQLNDIQAINKRKQSTLSQHLTAVADLHTPDLHMPDLHTPPSLKARTVEVCLLRTDTHYTINDLFNSFQNYDIHPQDIEAIGQYQSNRRWHVCLKEVELCNYLLSLESFVVKNQNATIQPIQENCFKIRVHWAPYWIPDDEIISKLKENEVNVTSCHHETYPRTNVRTMVRIYLVNAESPSLIPYMLKLENGANIMITHRNRKPMCLSCKAVGHISKECRAATVMKAPVGDTDGAVTDAQEMKMSTAAEAILDASQVNSASNAGAATSLHMETDAVSDASPEARPADDDENAHDYIPKSAFSIPFLNFNMHKQTTVASHFEKHLFYSTPGQFLVNHMYVLTYEDMQEHYENICQSSDEDKT